MDLEEAQHDLLFGVRRSIRYHNRRRGFFDRSNKVANILTAASGSATIAAVLAKLPNEFVLVFSALVAIISAVDLVIGTASAARLHHDLARRFTELEKELTISPPASMPDLAALQAKRLTIEADEPPALRVLDCICHNELLRAMGYGQEHMARIHWYQRLFAQLFDIREHAIEHQEPVPTIAQNQPPAHEKAANCAK